MKGLLIALQFLTRLPGPRLTATGAEFAASMRWFPAVGLVVGAFVMGGAALLAPIDPWVAVLVALLLWVGVTGALHLDGLGDIADASGAAHKDRARLLAVLADPHVGSFAVVTIALQLLAKLVLLHALIVTGALLPLLLIPFAARIAPLVWTLWLPPLHPGLGAQFRGVIRVRDLVLWATLLVIAAWIVPALLAVLLLIPLWGFWLKHRIGGLSGDGHGAGIELIESGLLLAALLTPRIT